MHRSQTMMARAITNSKITDSRLLQWLGRLDRTRSMAWEAKELTKASFRHGN